MKAKFKLILGRRRQYPLHLELEVYKGVDCRVFISTGIILESEKQWDAARQIVIKNTNEKQYNDFLRQMIQNVVDAETEAEKRGNALTAADIKMAVKSQTAKGEDVIETFRVYAQNAEVRESTRRGLFSRVNNLLHFAQLFKGSKNATLYFGEMNLNVIKELDKYLYTIGVPSTVSGTHLTFRKFFTLARKDGLIAVNPYEKFDLEIHDSKRRVALSSEQLQNVEALTPEDLEKGKVPEHIYDMFMFACYTGLRLSDVSTISREHLYYENGGLVVQKVTIKTGILVTQPLHSLFNGKPERIAQKYLELYQDSETLFPKTKPQHIQESIARLGELAKIPFHLTFHMSRHTCASQLAERSDNPFVIMNILGHGDIRTSMRYIHLSHTTAKKKLEGINWDAEEYNGPLTRTSNDDLAKIQQELTEVCTRKKLSEALTLAAIGASICHVDKSDLIREWIGKIRKTDYTLEAWSKRLEILVG